MSEPVIRYLNTDLDLVCDVDLACLAAELEARGLCVDVTQGPDKLWYVRCSGENDREPERNIRRLLVAVESFTDEARAVWQRYSTREFNAGYDCGDEPWAFSQVLSNDVLQRMASCGATFGITLYPYRPDPDWDSEDVGTGGG